jgi:outer membrane beta-barrel protein
LFLNSAGAFASQVRLPDEELARESVLPVFDHAPSVLNRTIVTAGRFEVGPMLGLMLNEAFYDPVNYGITASYHINETHGFNFTGHIFGDGRSRYAIQIDQEINGANLKYAPNPEFLALLNYQLTGYYGKLSLTKNYVMNLSLFFSGGVGMLGFGGDIFPAANAGIGQKFYLTKSIALRTDLRVLLYSAPNVLNDKIQDTLANANEKLDASAFNTDNFYNTLLGLSLVVLL